MRLFQYIAVLTGMLSTAAFAAIPEESEQVVLVLVKNPRDFKARVAAFERAPGGTWKNVVPLQAATVGKNGIAWGIGEYDPKELGLPEFNHKDPNTPYRIQGGSRAPAGIFRIGKGFGKHPQSTLETWYGGPLKWPYFQINANSHCAGDVEDFPTYNTTYPDITHIPKTFRLSEGEQLIDYVTGNSMQYEFSLDILHNSDQTKMMSKKPYGGACIFMHVWSNDGTSGTAGCTGLKRETMFQVLSWINPDKNPVIVQLTDDDYQKLKGSWKLP